MKLTLIRVLSFFAISGLLMGQTALEQKQAAEAAAIELETSTARQDFFNFISGRPIENVQLLQNNSLVVIEESFKYLELKPGLKKRLAHLGQTETIFYTLLRSPKDRPDRAGSFHRGRRSLFMDLGSIDKNNFLLIFIHELAHGVDDVMRTALSEFSNSSTRTQVIEILERKQNPADLNSQERNLIRAWLIAGLERGLLAEYRAWLFTYLAYQEGLRDGTLQPTEWLDRLHNTKPENTTIEEHIYRTLSQNWHDPQDDVFANPIISELLKEIRQEFYANPRLIKMGNIGQLIEGTAISK